MDDGSWCWNGYLNTHCSVATRGSIIISSIQKGAGKLRLLGGSMWYLRAGPLKPMWAHPRDRHALASGCRGVRAWLGPGPSADAQREWLYAGGPGALVGALLGGMDDRELLDACTTALGLCVAGSRENQLAAGDAGGMLALVAALQRWPHIPAMREKLFQLGRFVGESPENSARLRNLGGLETIVSLAEGYGHADGMTAEAVQAAVSTQGSAPENVFDLAGLGYIEHTLRALRAWADAPRHRRTALWVISSLFMSQSAWREKWADGGLIDLVVGAMRDEVARHARGDPSGAPADTALAHRTALQCLLRLAKHNETHGEMVFRSGALQQLGAGYEALGDIPHMPPLQEACQLIRIATRNGSIGSAGEVVESPGVLSAMRGVAECEGLLPPA